MRKTFIALALGIKVKVFIQQWEGPKHIVVGVIKFKKFEKAATFNVNLYSKRKMKQIIASKWERLVDVTTRREVYFYSSGTDCDGFSSGHRVKYDNIMVAEKDQEEDYKWADGPLYFSRITKAEYEEAESYHRDHGMEAYEDGHPHSLHL